MPGGMGGEESEKGFPDPSSAMPSHIHQSYWLHRFLPHLAHASSTLSQLSGIRPRQFSHLVGVSEYLSGSNSHRCYLELVWRRDDTAGRGPRG